MLALAYAGGALGHVFSKWLGWAGAEKGRPPLLYWRQYWPLVLQGLLVDGVLYGAWASGVIDLGVDTTVPMAAMAGWIADSVGKTALMSFETRRRNGHGGGKDAA